MEGGGPDIRLNAPTFFSERYTFEVLHNLNVFKGQLTKWPLMHDPELEFDFFASTGNLRFYFTAFSRELFLELRSRDGRWLEASVFMLHGLRSSAHDGLFGNLHTYITRGGVWPPAIRMRLTRIDRHDQDGHLQLAVHFLGRDATGAVLQVLSAATKAQLLLPLKADLSRSNPLPHSAS